jgi:hypothetical protein
MQSFTWTPVLIILAALLIIGLIWLTMRSIIRRDRAMINEDMDEPHEIESYKDRWRDKDAS